MSVTRYVALCVFFAAGQFDDGRHILSAVEM